MFKFEKSDRTERTMEVSIETFGPNGGPKSLGTGTLEGDTLECTKNLVVGGHYNINGETREILEIVSKGLTKWKYRVSNPC